MNLWMIVGLAVGIAFVLCLSIVYVVIMIGKKIEFFSVVGLIGLLLTLSTSLVGVTIGLVLPPESIIVPLGKIAIITICLFILIGFVIWLMNCAHLLNEVAHQTWVVSLISVIVMMAIIGISMQIEQSNFWLWFYIPGLILFLSMFVISIFTTEQSGQGYWFRKFWNPSKGLAGMGFGDFASSIGILAGVGAYQLEQVSAGWFWLGQFGAALVMIIGLNQILRWMREKDTNDWFYTFIPYLGGVFTFLALITAGKSLNRSGDLQTMLKIFQTIFLGLLLIGAGVIFFKNNRPNRHFVLLGLGILLLTGGLITGIWLIPSAGSEPDNILWLTNLFGALATGTGIVLEGFTFYQIWKPFWTGTAYIPGNITSQGEVPYYIEKWKEPIKLIRGLDIILGNIALFAMIFWATDESSYNAGQWFLFSGAIVLMVHASLGGIVISANEVAERRARERAVEAAARQRVFDEEALQMLQIGIDG